MAEPQIRSFWRVQHLDYELDNKKVVSIVSDLVKAGMSPIVLERHIVDANAPEQQAKPEAVEADEPQVAQPFTEDELP